MTSGRASRSSGRTSAKLGALKQQVSGKISGKLGKLSRRSRKEEDQKHVSATAVMEEIGINIGQLVPRCVDLRVPVSEACLYTVSLWQGERKNGGLRPPRFHPNGTRQKLLHAWACGA